MTAAGARRPRRLLALALLFLAGLAAYWALQEYRLRLAPAADLLARLPPGAALYAAIDLAGLRSSPQLAAALESRLARNDALEGLLDEPLEAAAVALEEGRALALVAGAFEPEAVRRTVERQGGRCPGDLAKGVCTLSAGGDGWLSLRLFDGGLAIANSANPDAADKLSAPASAISDLAAHANQRLRKGAVVWAHIDPARLDEAAAEPPPGWVNLSLFSRALRQAREAQLSVEAGEPLLVELRAACPTAEDAAELGDVLSGLSSFAAALLRRQPEASDWAEALQSFEQEVEGETLVARWQVEREALVKWLQTSQPPEL